MTDLTDTAFSASDSEFASPGYAQVDANSIFAIAHVSFLVHATAVDGDRGLIFGGGTSLSDVNGDPSRSPRTTGS